MSFREMKIQGAWIHTPARHSDIRGHFEEQFKLSSIESALKRQFTVKQVNQSVSLGGVLRGIHYSEGPVGQAKYVSCSKGRIWDVVVDLRKDSVTYGSWDATELSANNGLSVLISEGLGHAFLSLEDGSVTNYLCTSEYDPITDKGFNPLSEDLAIPFQETAKGNGFQKIQLSERDATATNFYLK